MQPAVLDGRSDRHVFQAQFLDEKRLQFRHGDFLGPELLAEPLTDYRLVVNSESVIVNLVAEHNIRTSVSELGHQPLKLVNAVGFVVYRNDDGQDGGQILKRWLQINLIKVIEKHLG